MENERFKEKHKSILENFMKKPVLQCWHKTVQFMFKQKIKESSAQR